MTTAHKTPTQQTISKLVSSYATFPQVVAIALSGSQASGTADIGSDIDLYMYTDGEFSVAEQQAVIEQAGGATRSNLNLPYWGGTNLWIDAATGIIVDAMYFDRAWMQQQVVQVMDEHQAGMGYTTCFCRTVSQSTVLYDPQGWFQALQERTRQPYPEALRHNIIEHNQPVLRSIMTSYWHQIEKALHRTDLVSVNHRVAALLASYFDIVFAFNRVLHPGEKRILSFVHTECTQIPIAIDADIAAVLQAAGTAHPDILIHLTRLLNRLDQLLAEKQ
jgi:Domain of unknown function (DUF4037)/Nucleotidyltransferase domain